MELHILGHIQNRLPYAFLLTLAFQLLATFFVQKSVLHFDFNRFRLDITFFIASNSYVGLFCM